VIGVTFIVAANAAILLLAVNPRGAEHLKDLLIGQILWVSTAQLPLIALLSAAILAALFGFHARKRRMWFYVVFRLCRDTVGAARRPVSVFRHADRSCARDAQALRADGSRLATASPPRDRGGPASHPHHRSASWAIDRLRDGARRRRADAATSRAAVRGSEQV
jgi:hypothetical protein